MLGLPPTVSCVVALQRSLRTAALSEPLSTERNVFCVCTESCFVTPWMATSRGPSLSKTDDIHGPQRVNPHNCDDSLTSSLL